MKIDIHTHTRACKSGDAATREIPPEDFCKAILSTEVKIVAVTNHNVFDLPQYSAITKCMGQDAQVWPGIELDIEEGESRGHLLVIVSPAHANEFSGAVNRLTKGATPDSFKATIDDVLQAFESLNPLYVAHYEQKKPNLSDGAIQKLLEGAKNRSRVMKEVTNAISAGIYISHGHASIFGSDIQDWADYGEKSRSLPDLRLPVDSFEHFCLLLDKDPTTINTALNRKTPELLELRPFEDDSILKLRVFDDINVIFGAKGTGESCILTAIEEHYAGEGKVASVYESGSDRLEEVFDIKGKSLTVNLNDYGIDYCQNAIQEIRNAEECSVTSITKYIGHFSAKDTNRNAKKILLRNIDRQEEAGPRREFQDFLRAVETTGRFLEFLRNNASLKMVLRDDEQIELNRLVTELLERLTYWEWSKFSEWKEIRLLNTAIEKFRSEIERKTGSPAKPATTGFGAYAMNRIRIAVNAARILRSVETEIPMLTERLGSLGPNKGELEFRTIFAFQTGSLTDGTMTSATLVKKGAQKNFVKCIRDISKHAFSDDLFQHVAELDKVDDVDEIRTVLELLLFKKCFVLNGEHYFPSSGEAAMVMLQKELGTDKDVYILDEPEKSLDNEYISEVIVPLIKERARAGKKIFISTHDANIAVRTLPYSSVFRSHGPRGYSTYVGNPFSNNLVNLADTNDHLEWKKVSMKTLEGGEEAFGERGKIYGND